MRLISKAGFAAFALLCAMPLSAQQVYQWKDEQGKTHYSDLPPPSQQRDDTRQFQLPPVSPSASVEPTMTPQSELAEQELQLRERLEEREKQKAEAEQNLLREQERQYECTRIANTLKALTSGVRVARPGPDGAREYMDDATRAAEIERTQKLFDDNCN